MLKGKILKGYAGFYYVQVKDSLYECKLRGRLKLTHQAILIGDDVLLTENGSKGVIEEILPRRTELVRPAIANIDQALIVFALKNPEPVLELLDRLLISVMHAGIKPILIFTKSDLASNSDFQVTDIYRQVGYTVITTGRNSGEGINKTREQLLGKISVVAGPSGAGKSTLLNTICSGQLMKTGEISAKVGRGKHTTRHVELLSLGNESYIADTPGFSILYLPEIDYQELASYYPEFLNYFGKCRFNGCLHLEEPQCAVRQAVAEGKIDSQRYQRYQEFLGQLIERKKRKYD